MKRPLIAFLVASALMVATAAPALAHHNPNHEPLGCESSEDSNRPAEICKNYE